MSTTRIVLPPRVPTGAQWNNMPIPLHQRIAVGSVAALLGTSVTFPVDTVKTRVQAANGSMPLRQVVRSIIGQEGALGFYRGLLPALIGTGPEKAVKLAVNDLARHALSPNEADITLKQQILAGAIAGCSQAVVSTPNEIVKLRMQLMDAEVALGMPRLSAVQVVRSLGVRGMFRGFSATLARDLPYNVAFFSLYATVKGSLCEDGDETPLRLLTAGATAGMLAAGLGTPMDVVKTRLQQRGSPYTGLVDCMRGIARSEGSRAFFKGAVNRMAVQAPMYAIVMAAFEIQKKYLASKAAARDSGRAWG